MSNVSAQEEFPMTLLDTKVLNPQNSETTSNKPMNSEQICVLRVLPSHSSDIRKVSWIEGSPQHQRMLDSGVTNKAACQSCANESSNRPMYHESRNRPKLGHSGRLSLPVNGKYANNHLRKTNGLQANAAIQHPPGKVNGLSSLLNNEHRSPSGNVNCCGSSVKRAFQQRDTEKPWKSKGDYFVVVLTYLLGVGNVIRFPQLCFKHGGGKM